MIRFPGRMWPILLVILLAAAPRASPSPTTPKRIAFLINSWYPTSHADVIGTRFIEGYRLGDKFYRSPLAVASVYADSPLSNDQTRGLAARYGFRVANSVAEALLENPGSPNPHIGVDGVLIATREDLPGSGQTQSPNHRLQIVREVLRIVDQTGARIPIFIDKMLAADWADSQAIVSEVRRRDIPLMAGSVLAYAPLDRPVPTGKVEVAMVIASTPYWAFAFHAAELLQAFMEQRTPHETGVSSIREVGLGFWSLPDRDRWGGRLFDALLASSKTRLAAASRDFGPGTHVLLIQYVDGTRAVLALVPRAFSDKEYLLGAQYLDGTISTGGLILRGAPFDHFGYLVHALVELYSTQRTPVPVERTLLTTGIVVLGQQAHEKGGLVSSPSLAISYPVYRSRP